MTRVALLTDAAWVRAATVGALSAPGIDTIVLDPGRSVAAQVKERGATVLVCDMQVGSMGAIAVVRDLREQAALGNLHPVRVLVLLDRAPDEFQARRAGAAAWLVKPANPGELLRAVQVLASGGTWQPAVAEESASDADQAHDAEAEPAPAAATAADAEA